MKRVRFLCALVSLVLAVILAEGVAYGQTFTLGFRGIDFNCGDRRTGAAGSAVEFDVFATLTSADIAAAPGAKGFSLSIGMENLELVPDLQPLPDDPETLEVDESSINNPKVLSGYMWDRIVEGGQAKTQAASIISGGFESTLPTDPDLVPDRGPLAGMGPQGHGLVSGVVITLTGKQSLPITGTVTLLRFKVRGTFPDSGDKVGRILYKEGLIAGGEPGKNVVTYNNQSRTATLEECIITLGALEPTFGFKVLAGGAEPVRGPGNSSVEIPANVGEKTKGVAFVYLDSMSLEAEGPKGWQFGLGLEGLNLIPALQPLLDDPNTPEVDESAINNPKILSGYHWDRTVAPNGTPLTDASRIYSAGFESSLPTDPNLEPDRGPLAGMGKQGQGVVGAMILTLTGKQTLPGNSISSILRVEFEQTQAFASETDAPQQGRLFFKAGLIAEGEPTGNVVTFKGKSNPPQFLSQLDVTFVPVQPAQVADSVRGDADGNASVNLQDALFIINYQFGTDLQSGGGGLPPAPPCLDAADPNQDNKINIADAIFVINALFRPEIGNVLPMICELDPQSTAASCPPGSTDCP